MSEKTFGVYLAKEDPESDAYAKLDLPAQPWELLDALDKLHLQEGDRLYLEIDDYYDFEELATVLRDQEDSLAELNDLAERLTRLNAVQCTALQGLIRMETAKGGGEISVTQLRNLTESVDCCHVVPETIDDSQLGRFYAENGFVPEVEGISDTVFELLDFAAIGLRARKEEGASLHREDMSSRTAISSRHLRYPERSRSRTTWSYWRCPGGKAMAPNRTTPAQSWSSCLRCQRNWRQWRSA